MVATVRTARSGRARVVRAGLTAAAATLGLTLVSGAASAAPPPGRAYELVSPNSPTGFSAGVDGEFKPTYSVSSGSGDDLMYSAMGPLASDPQRSISVPPQIGRRTSEGWETTDPIRMSDPSMPLNYSNTQPRGVMVSSDMRRLAFTSTESLTPDVTGLNLTYRTEVDGPLTWLNEPTRDGASVAGGLTLVGGAPDLSRVVFYDQGVLTDDLGDPDRVQGGLYEGGDGGLRPFTLPDGLVPAGGTAPADMSGLNFVTRRNAVSRDGRRTFFVSPNPGIPLPGASSPDPNAPQLYVKDGDRTVLLSQRAGSPAPNGIGDLADGRNDIGTNVAWAHATPDGSRVVFASRSALTSDAPENGLKYYRADVATGGLEVLEGVDGPPIAVDDDASRILFVDGLDLRDGAAYADLKLWDRGTITRLASGIQTIASTAAAGSASGTSVYSAAFAEGDDAVVFRATGSIDPKFPDANTAPQAYRWSPGDAAPSCLSCSSGDAQPGRNGANLTNWTGNDTETLLVPATPTNTGVSTPGPQQGRFVSADGRRVVFDSPDALVPEDTNGVRDVYLWERGTLHLVTSGVGRNPSYVLDMDEDGSNVFFSTQDGLVKADTDAAYDVYDARVGGGFPDAPDVSCVGDACQPPATAAPALTAPGSHGVAPETRGPDVDDTRQGSRLRVSRVAVSGSRVRFRVRVPSAGRIVASGRMTRTVRAASTKAGTRRVTVRLTARAARQLRSRGRLRVVVRVRFLPKTGKAVTSTVKTTIKRAARS